MHRDVGFSTAIAFSADGAAVFDATTGARLRTIKEKFQVFCLSFSPTAISMLAVSARAADAIHVWDIDSGEMIRNIVRSSRVAIFSPDGRTIATATTGVSGDVLLMDAASGEMRFRMVGHTSAVHTASWCPHNGSKFATGSSDDGTCNVWDSSTGALLRTINIGTTIFCEVWGRDWVRDTQGAMASAMGNHPRLGGVSQVLELEAGVVRMILDRM